MSPFDASNQFVIPRRRSPLAPLVVGAALAAIALAGKTRIGAWLRGFFAPPTCSAYSDVLEPYVSAGLPLPQLRRSLLGHSMAFVVNALGPPRSVAGAATITASSDAGPGAFWRSDTWYYPLDPRKHTAIAIHFAAGVAQQVDFFEMPTSIEA
jgi:hypothetical protein